MMTNTTTATIISNFVNSIKSEATKNRYIYLLNRYVKFLHYDTIDKLICNDLKLIESDIIRYIIFLKNESKISANTINMYLAAIMHFYTMNDVLLNRKKVGKYIGESVRVEKDRAYTTQEIHHLLDFCDERTKALVLLLASSGIRIGALSGLDLNHLHKIKEYNLYLLTIYSGTKDEYFTFCTPEAARAIDTYLDFRTRAGEKLSGNSPLFRKQFDQFNVRRPERLTEGSISKLLEDKLHKSGITVETKETESTKHGRKRNEVARAHGFRKFATTNMVRAKLNPEAREMLLGHSIGLSNAYYRPTEDELLQEYLKAVDMLTINEENRLRRKVEELEIEESKWRELESAVNELKKKVT